MVPHEFKNYDTLLFNQKDFMLRTKPEPIDNPHNLSVFDKKLKATFEREQARLHKETEAKILEGKQKWVRSFPLPESYQPIAKDVPMKGKESTEFL